MKLQKDFKLTTLTIISILWVLVVFLIVESILRFGSEYKISGMAYDGILGWRFKENIRYTRKSPFGKEYRFFTNSKGFRDKEHYFAKGNNTKRIMFLGDSYTVGDYVSQDAIFTALFENMIKENKTDNNKYDVMNVAVSAWAADQQFLYLKYKGVKYKPDYLFLMIAPNDIRGGTRNLFCASPKIMT